MENSRFGALDGWRGISIALVLAGHLLPLGPKAFQANHMAAVAGMAIFFILSGFLITHQLSSGMPVKAFLIRRLFRIAPLAIAILALLFLTGNLSAEELLRLTTFTANLPPTRLGEHTGHYWSLCLEVQFYLFAAIVAASLGRRGLWILFPLGLAVTLYRVSIEAYVDIHTLKRADEILAGASLALLLKSGSKTLRDKIFGIIPWWIIAPVFLASCHPECETLNYFRPYLAMWMVGSTLHTLGTRSNQVFASTTLTYTASISYALYIFHGVLMESWLGTGNSPLEKYLKRPILIAITFLGAHLSTKYFEQTFIEYGKSLSKNKSNPSTEARK